MTREDRIAVINRMYTDAQHHILSRLHAAFESDENHAEMVRARIDCVRMLDESEVLQRLSLGEQILLYAELLEAGMYCYYKDFEEWLARLN